MAGFSFTPIKPPKPPSWVAAGRGISKPSSSRNPFFSQASGKPWDPASQVHGGPVTYSGAPPQAPAARLGIRPGPQAPGAPGQAPGTSATTTTGAADTGPPLDATAINNIATNRFNVNNKVNSANQNIGSLRTNLQAALGQLAYQQPRDQLAQEQAANRSGALYSTAYNQRLGDLNHTYETKQSGLTTNEGQQEGGIAAQIQALLGGVPLYNQGQANASVSRAIAAAAANPATGQTPSLTPEQIKYINAGLAGPAATSKPSGSITDRGPWVTSKKGLGKPPSRAPIRDPFGGGFSSTVRRVR